MESGPLETLAYAISDVGLWTWWISDSNNVQLEFDRTMLFIEDTNNNETPINKIALRFVNPKSVTFIYKKESRLSENWLELFEQDKLEPFSVDYEYFSFDDEQINEILASADSTEIIMGNSYHETKNKSTSQLGFWAGDVGLVIVADTMKMVSYSGIIELDQIPELHNKWWDYWRKYWELKDSKSPLPYDPLCEITIPATNENIETMKKNFNK